MKINEVEQILGITKANIRFYEKEGLLTPGRTENGYREYSEADIARLKEIVIYRKLGIPVRQIEDILDGVSSLPDALDANIQSLNAGIEKLNGSLALCKQLQAEDARTLDTERYWELIHSKEQQGFGFQTLAEDYLGFVDQHIRNVTMLPEESKKDTKKVILYILIFSVTMSLIQASSRSYVSDIDYATAFGNRMEFWLFLKIIFPFIVGLFMIPAFIIARKNKKYGKIAEHIIKWILVLLILYFGMKKIFT